MSIRDSKDCFLSPDITIMAGKNESGKTAVLKALAEIMNARKIEDVSQSALPLDLEDDDSPEVFLTFSHDAEELATFEELAKCSIGKSVRQDLLRNGTTWQISASNRDCISDAIDEVVDSPEMVTNWRSSAAAIVDNLTAAGQALPETWSERIDRGDFNPTEFTAMVSPLLKQAELVHPTAGQAIRIQLAAFSNATKTSASDRLRDAIYHSMPTFIYFDEFLDEVPFNTSFADAQNHEGLRNLATIAKLDLDKLAKITNLRKRQSLLEEHSAVLTGDFGEFWNQDDIVIVFRDRGDEILTSIMDKDGKVHFEVAQRSRGFRYFISFYAKLNAQAGGNKILLIDEPGLFLHAKAQEDALSVLEKLSDRYQIVFSTHSPYMIRADRMDRVRLVSKSPTTNLSVIQNKPHAGADHEAFRPIVTALGLDVQRAFGNFSRRNLIVEGPSDYYILNAFQGLTSITLLEDTSIIPCVGATNVSVLASFLTGSGLPYVAMFDNDREGKIAAGKLRASYVGVADPAIFVSDVDSECIEDLFHRSDFVKYFIGEGADPKSFGDLSNSQIAKRENLDKVLRAKLFFEAAQAGNVKLTETSTKRLGALIAKINEHLDDNA